MLTKRLTTSVLALLLACAALSCAPDSSRDDSLLGPQTSEVTQQPTAEQQDSLLTTDDAVQASDAALLHSQGYYWIKAPAQQQSTSLLGWLIKTVQATLAMLIDVVGGVLTLLGHSILVPPGAVDEPTIFTMTVIQNGYIEVDLTATPKSLLRRLFSWGRTEPVQFNVPVDLSLSYARATNVSDPSRLKIMRLMPDGRHEILPSTVDTAKKTVTAELDHFSRYCLIAD